MKTPTIKELRNFCKKSGIKFRRIVETNEYVVGGYFTDDIRDAMDTAHHMVTSRMLDEVDKKAGIL